MQWEQFCINVRHLSDADQQIVRKAFERGETAHAGQYRQSGEPFFSHPIAVACILINLGADRDTIIAGLLHDTVEDTPITIDDIQREFGPGVANLIHGVTKLEHVDSSNQPHLDQQIETLRKMFTLMQEDIRIMVIKLADRLHNMQTIRFRTSEKQLHVARETMDVYVKVANRLCMQDLQKTLEGLCLAVLEPELHKALLELQAQQEIFGKKLVETIQPALTKAHADIAEGVQILPEQKSWVRLREQLQSNGKHTTGLATVSLEFVCNDVDQCYQVLGALHQEWQREILSFQDFINSHMINGYQGIHTTIILSDGTRVRCKIRTHEMQQYAHRGITMFCFDSQEKGLMEYLPWTQRIGAISSDTSDRSAEFWDGLQSDILGSMITVHGPDDGTVLLPTNATVLDAAFYLFGELALRVEQIYMNGQSVSFDEATRNATTITATFSRSTTVNLQWLRSVHTGIASAIIRKHLNTATMTDKRSIGEELLDVAMHRILHIRVDEVSPRLLEMRAQRWGIGSIDALFESIASGTIDANDVATELRADFDPHILHNNKRRAWILRARVDDRMTNNILSTLRTLDANRISINRVNNKTHIIARLLLDHHDLTLLEREFSVKVDHTSWSLRRAYTSRIVLLSIGVLLGLWGLDPVIARMFLTFTTPVDLTIIRAATFFVASSIMFGIQIIRRRKSLRHLSPRNPILILSGVALFLTALLSYSALTGLTATAYILCIVWAMLTMIALRKWMEGGEWLQSAIAGCFAGVGAMATTWSSGIDTWTLAAGAGAGIGFMAYSECSAYYQRSSESIQVRYPEFLFWMSCIGIVLAALLFPFSTVALISGKTLILTAIFVLTFSVLPYNLYFEITRRTDSSILDPLLPIATVVTLCGEFSLIPIGITAVGAVAIALFLTYFYGSRMFTAGAGRTEPSNRQ